MKLFLTGALVCVASLIIAQPKMISVSFLKNDGKYVNNKDSADYFRLVSVPDSGTLLFNVTEYYKDGKRKLIGKTSKVEPPVFEEQCATFYENGKRESTSNYKDGVHVGDEYDFYPNGKPYLVKEFPDNNDPNNDFTDNFLIKANYDSLGTVLVENGNGYFKGFDDKFTYTNEEGPVKNEKREGAWKGFFKNTKTNFFENYRAGELIDGKATDGSGVSVVYTKSRLTPPRFPGGIDAFYQYLGRHIIYPDDDRRNNVQGQVIIIFYVEKTGKLSDIKVSKSATRTLDDEAIRVIKNCPVWVPGTLFGKPQRVAYQVPIVFALSDH